ncbi:MAG: hypothetical protein ACOYJI_01400 [Anaerovoracaceae bacterium]|jgi:hypothetical protein
MKLFEEMDEEMLMETEGGVAARYETLPDGTVVIRTCTDVPGAPVLFPPITVPGIFIPR